MHMYYVDTGKRVTRFNFVVVTMNINFIILLVSFLLVGVCVCVCVLILGSEDNVNSVLYNECLCVISAQSFGLTY